MSRHIDPATTIGPFARRRPDGEWDHTPLSNFFPSPIGAPGGAVAATVEHYFAAAKSASKTGAAAILAAPTPSAAKAMGRTVDLRPDWETIKFGVMRRALAAKFATGSALGNWLVGTAPFELVEMNQWRDAVWGNASRRTPGPRRAPSGLTSGLIHFRHHHRPRLTCRSHPHVTSTGAAGQPLPRCTAPGPLKLRASAADAGPTGRRRLFPARRGRRSRAWPTTR